MTGAVTFEMDSIQLPAFSSGAYALMSDGNVIAHMSAGDSLETALANLGTFRATHPRVREYAAMLAADHGARREKVAALGARIAPAPMLDDSEVARLSTILGWLDSTPAGETWDSAFLRFQVNHHQNEIAILNANSRNSHDGELASLMSESLTSLVKHRDTGRSVSTVLGVRLP